MRYTIRIALLFMFASNIVAAPPLVGKWKSDHAATMQFIKEHVRLESKHLEFLDQLIGNLVITVGVDEATSWMPDIELNLSGESHHFEGHNKTVPFRIIGQTEETIAVSTVDPAGKKILYLYHFESPDLMWVYSDGVGDFQTDIHIREYFRRLK